MFSLRNKKKIPLNYPQYPHLSGALISGVSGLLHNRIMTPNKQEHLSLKQKDNTHIRNLYLVLKAKKRNRIRKQVKTQRTIVQIRQTALPRQAVTQYS